jgi:hypothetical protein
LSTIMSTIVHTSVLHEGIRCMAMRDGMSKGPFLLADDRPADEASRDDLRHRRPLPSMSTKLMLVASPRAVGTIASRFTTHRCHDLWGCSGR